MSPERKLSMEMQKIARELADRIAGAAGEPHGFVLITFPLGRTGASNYVSNANRADVLSNLSDIIVHMSASGADVPLHKVN